MKSTKPLKTYRKKIDSIDKKIILLLSKRIGIAKNLKKIKRQQSLKTTDKAREQEVITNARTIAREHGLEPDFTEDIFKKIIKYMREKQR